jgi:plasmid replication initiation protein
MSNALTRAGHGLSLSEKRIVGSAIAKLDSRSAVPPAGGVVRTKLTAAEFAETFDIDLDTAYRQLKSAAKHLYERSITFYEPASRRKGKAIEPTMTTMRWVGSVKYHKGEGWVELYWWPQLMTHLVGLKKHFTSIQLKQTTALRSAYSWRLLELLMRFDDKKKEDGVAEYTLEDFEASMGPPPSIKGNFGQLRRRVIDPAVKELNGKDGWAITWEAVKRGRVVKAVRFSFRRDPQQRLPFDPD